VLLESNLGLSELEQLVRDVGREQVPRLPIRSLSACLLSHVKLDEATLLHCSELSLASTPFLDHSRGCRAGTEGPRVCIMAEDSVRGLHRNAETHLANRLLPAVPTSTEGAGEDISLSKVVKISTHQFQGRGIVGAES